MLIAWMAYATLLGALLAGAAFALERAVGVWGGARRGVWLAALVLVIVVPLCMALRPSVAPPQVGSIIDQRVSITLSSRGGATDVADSVAVAGAAGTHVTRRHTPTLTAATAFARLKIPAAWLLPLARWTRYAAAAWAALSLSMFALFIRGVLIVRSRRKTWRDAALDGSRVFVADDVGPAVVGIVHPVVVIPTWALDLGDDERTLMLRHEREHVDAGDPGLLLVAALAIIVFPWNAAVWFLARRLRLAIEIDCDARVLRAVGRPREYGMLLLVVGSRRTTPLPLAASLAERRPLLERRILAMTNVRPAHPILVSSPFLAIACTAAALAAQTPLPAAPPAAPALAAAPATPPAWRSGLSFSSQVRPAMPAAPATPATPPNHPVPPTVSPVPASPVSRPLLAAAAESSVAPTALAEPPAAPARRIAPSAPREIPIEVIRGWIERYHPSILVGDTSIAVVTVVVSANDEYISSVTDKLPDNVQGDVAVLDPLAGLRAEGIENIQLLKGAAAAAEYGPDALNGVVVVTTKRGLADPAHAATDTAAAKSLARLVQLRLAGGTAKIGHDPIYIVDGVLVNPQPAPTPSSNGGASLERIGVPSDGIGSVEILKLAPGRIGPNALRVVLVKLRGRG